MLIDYVVNVQSQSRSESPQASWTAGGHRERLWGNGKICFFRLAVHSNKTKNLRLKFHFLRVSPSDAADQEA